MKKVAILTSVIAVFLLATTVIAKDRPNGRPFQAIWDEIGRIWDAIDGLDGGECSCDCTCDITREEFDDLEERVEALEEACTPSVEVCDGIDNDCDGLIDEGSIWANKDDTCIVGTGVCEATGVYICDEGDPSGPTVCDAEEGASSEEVCDGLDNDCDGTADEGIACGENGESCSIDSECLSANCECADASCTSKLCSAVHCACEYNVDGDEVCDGYISQGYDDASNTCGENTCDGNGGCLLPLGSACVEDSDCLSTNCVDDVCCDTTCDGTCEACVASKTEGSDGTCDYVTTGTDPDYECGISEYCDGAGSCA